MLKIYLSALAVGLWSLSVLAGGPFYRIIWGHYPGPERDRINRILLGGEDVRILYLDDVLAELKRTGKKVYHVDGIVWHNDVRELVIQGTENPASDLPDGVAMAEDKNLELKFLKKYLPKDAFELYVPKAGSLERILKKLDIDVAKLKTRPQKIRALQEISQEIFEENPGGYFAKPVDGLASSGYLLTDKIDWAKTWLEHVDGVNETPEGALLEQLLEGKPFRVEEKIIAARYLTVPANGGFRLVPEEYRVHIYEGEVIPGATSSRWEEVRGLSLERMKWVEAQVQEFVSRFSPEIRRKVTLGADFIVARKGGKTVVQLVESNPIGSAFMWDAKTSLYAVHLLYERATGYASELLKAFRAFKSAPTLAERIELLHEFMAREEIYEVQRMTNGSINPISELLIEAKEALMEKVREAGTAEAAEQALGAMREYRAQEFLSTADFDLLGTLLRSRGHSLREIGAWLGIRPNELLYETAEGHVRSVVGLAYSNTGVKDFLLVEAKAELSSAQAVGLTREAAAEAVSRRVARRYAIFASELRENPDLLESIAFQDGELALGKRLLYKGTLDGLAEELAQALLKR